MDVASDGGWLGTALTIVNLIQSVMQVRGAVHGAVHDAVHDADRNGAGRNVIHGVVRVAGIHNVQQQGAWRTSQHAIQHAPPICRKAFLN